MLKSVNMGDKVAAFLQNQEIHDLYQLTREELSVVARELEIVLEMERKEDMQKELKCALEERGWFRGESGKEGGSDGEGEGRDFRGFQMPSLTGLMEGLTGSDKVELIKLQMQMQVQTERMRIEAEKEVRLKQVETGSNGRDNRDVDRRERHVPLFVEGEEENFFLQFEKTAKLRNWDEEDWALLVQSKFTGKAREAYVSLGDEEVGDYESVKEAVLRSTLLSPRVYRERFRNTKKHPGSTYLEMARECGLKFDRWMKSEDVKTMEDMRETILLEHFMDQVHPDIKYELISHGVKDIMEAGRRADSYCEAHGVCKGDQGGRKPFPNKIDGQYKFRNNNNINYTMSSVQYNRPYQPRPFNYNCNTQHYPNYNNSMYKPNQPKTHNYNLRATESRNWRDGQYYKKDGTFGDGGAVKCLSCGVAGHRKFECYKNKPKPVGAVAAQRDLLEFIRDMNPTSSPEEQQQEDFEHFTIKGKVKLSGGQEKEIRILRDTGANQSLILQKVLPWDEESKTGREVACKGAGSKFNVPLHTIWLDCGYVTGEVVVGVKDTLPVDGVDMLMGNDLAGKKVIPNLQMVENPVQEILESNIPTTVLDSTSMGDMVPEVFPVCAVTRAMARRGTTHMEEVTQEDPDLGDFFVEPSDLKISLGNEENNQVEQLVEPKVEIEIEKNTLIQEQEKDGSLKTLWNEARKADNVDEDYVGSYVEGGVLMRSWRPLDSPANEHWKVKRQIVVPQIYRKKILELAHEGSLAGHLGVRKTLGKIMCHFYWPKVKCDVANFCKTCALCQRVGKPNQLIQPAPLKPIPVIEEPFSKIVIDCVGPLPLSLIHI